MHTILEASELAEGIVSFLVSAPKIANRSKPGQFVIVRVSEHGERIPLTIADASPPEGWIRLVVQGVGKTTDQMNALRRGDSLIDLAGPLGRPTDVELFGTVVVVGGGVGTAIALPSARAFAAAGNTVVGIIGARTQRQLILEDEMRAACHDLLPCTDDGSYGFEGLVTDRLSLLLHEKPVDRVLAIGPVPMMQAIAATTAPSGIATVVSLNPIMVDGTGMCGGCRVTVGGRVRFACVDGPEFDAHQVDFDELARRNRSYEAWEYFRRIEFEESSAMPSRRRAHG